MLDVYFFFFFLMIRRPPRSTRTDTLFPYTTLFRSQESGIRRDNRLIPWPWSLNVAGQSHRYATRAEACAGLQQALRNASPKRIDAGLAQINLGYQQHRYNRPCELLDPYVNLQIAATILREQYKPGEDWLLAMGRYHRPAGGKPAARRSEEHTSELSH